MFGKDAKSEEPGACRGAAGRKGYAGLELRRAGLEVGSCEHKGSSCSQAPWEGAG